MDNNYYNNLAEGHPEETPEEAEAKLLEQADTDYDNYKDEK